MIVPTGYTNKATAVSADSLWGYDSEGVANVNFPMSVIQTYVLNALTTSSIAEGTNLYYTEDRVDNNTTVVSLGTDKADKSNVLELDNTTVYTPTAPYHPATMDYVDNVAMPEVATDAEAIAGTNETKFINPKQAKDIYGFSIIYGDNVLATSNTDVSFSDATYTKKKEIEVDRAGTYKVYFTIYRVGGVTYGKIYVNGSPIGIERSTGVLGPTGETFTEAITVSDGDLVQVYCYNASGGNIKNFGIGFDTVSNFPTATVNL